MAFEYNAEKTQSQLRKALDFAKKNPSHPDAQELRRRMERGQFNFELKNMGLPEVPIERPKVDLKRAMSSVQQEEGLSSTPPEASMLDIGTSVESLKERGGDILETAQGMGRQVSQGADKMQEVWQNDSFNALQKFMGTVGAAAGAGAGVIGEGFTGVGKLALTQEGEDAFKAKMQEIGDKASETKVVKGIADWYEGLNEDNKLVVDSLGGIVQLAAELVGVKGTGKLASTTVDATAPVVREGIQAGSKLVQEGAEAVGRGIDTVSDTVKASRLATQQEKVNEAVGRITQAGSDTRAREQAARALTDIDRTGIETYSDLNTRFDDRITALSRNVDTELGKYPDVLNESQWTKTTKVGDETVVQNPIKDALDGLENAYTLSGEAVEAARIRQIKSKLQAEGITLKEANDIAREYGIEFKDRAFSKLGDPKAGYNAENFENVRKGVKEAVREKMPDDLTKELDSKISDIYATKRLTEKIENQVAKLEDRIKRRTLSQKVWGGVTDILDAVTFGGIRGFFLRALPSNVGNKTMNALDIQGDLQKQLNAFDKLNKIKDEKAFAEALTEYVNEIQPGLSIKSSVTPESVAKKIDTTDRNKIVEFLDNPNDLNIQLETESLFEQIGINNADVDTQVRFLKEVLNLSNL